MPENLELKQKVFKDMDVLLGADTIVASSSSCLCASMIADGLAHQANMLVAHPVSTHYEAHFKNVLTFLLTHIGLISVYI